METTAECGTPAEVHCPHCAKRTNHIQAYEHPVILFAFVYVSFSTSAQQVFGCPPCVRKQLRTYALMSVVMANVLCWFPLTVILANYWSSRTHTEPVIPPEFEYLAQARPITRPGRESDARARRKRLAVVLFIMVIVIVTLVFVLPAVSR